MTAMTAESIKRCLFKSNLVGVVGLCKPGRGPTFPALFRYARSRIDPLQPAGGGGTLTNFSFLT